jgi:Recombination endonuclease VII
MSRPSKSKELDDWIRDLGVVPVNPRKEYQKAYVAANKDKIRQYYINYRDKNRHHKARYDRRYNYGVTEDEFKILIDNQLNKCLLCCAEFGKDNKPHVDHDHDKKLVRGLLCHSCNVGLGHFKDNVDTLQRAINYLNKNGQ